MDAKLTADEMWYVTTFEDATGATVKDCIKNSDEIIFVVKKGDMGLAIGKKGININRAREKLGKRIEVIEHSDDPVEFVKRLFHPFRVEDGKTDNENDKVVRISIDERDKKMAIGLKGKKLSKVKMLAKRFHGIEDIIIA
jgi:N utilization substance protein A